MTQREILEDKLKDFTAEDRQVLKFILTHGKPRRAEVAAAISLAASDQATLKARAIHLVDTDFKTQSYSIVPHFEATLREILFSE